MPSFLPRKKEKEEEEIEPGEGIQVQSQENKAGGRGEFAQNIDEGFQRYFPPSL